jgi:hypothetical protein
MLVFIACFNGLLPLKNLPLLSNIRRLQVFRNKMDGIAILFGRDFIDNQAY